jgi:hypothetical protein
LRPRRATAGANAMATACHGFRNAFFDLGADKKTEWIDHLVYLALWNLRTKRNGQEQWSPRNCYLSLPNRRACAMIIRVVLEEVAGTHFEPSLLPTPFPDEVKILPGVFLSRQGPGSFYKVELQTSLASLCESSSANLL